MQRNRNYRAWAPAIAFLGLALLCGLWAAQPAHAQEGDPTAGAAATQATLVQTTRIPPAQDTYIDNTSQRPRSELADPARFLRRDNTRAAESANAHRCCNSTCRRFPKAPRLRERNWVSISVLRCSRKPWT